MGGASMIALYKRKANIAGAICMATLLGLFVLGRVLAWTGHNVTGGGHQCAQRRVNDPVWSVVLIRDVGVPEGQGPVRRLGAIGSVVDRDDCHPAAEGPRQGRAAACSPCTPRVFRLATSMPPEDLQT